LHHALEIFRVKHQVFLSIELEGNIDSTLAILNRQ
jgi:hypothetical protein